MQKYLMFYQGSPCHIEGMTANGFLMTEQEVSERMTCCGTLEPKDVILISVGADSDGKIEKLCGIRKIKSQQAYSIYS
jgi:hypothetical protein